MIVISGVLVFVAAGLLVDGVFFTSGSAGTPWQIWVSIAVSAGAALLLVAGALRERARGGGDLGEPAVPAAPRPAVSPEALRIPPPPAAGTAPTAPPAALGTASTAPPTEAVPAAVPPAPVPPAPAGPATPAAATAGSVLVVPGRPRYHLAGCRYVTGRPAQPLDPAEARAAGYTACGVCRPDDAGGPPTGAQAATAAPAVDPAEEEADRAAAAAGATTPVVLVRNRYHRPDCRYVAVAAERTDLTKAEARDRGALPCGVCRP